MSLTLASIRRPVFISMFVLALVIMGILARKDMPKEANPDVEFPFVTVVTAYPGAGPQEIETLVTQPLEDAVAGINGVRHVTSVSRDGISIVAIEFLLGTNSDSAAADVRDKVSGTRGSLPREVLEPSVQKLNITGMPIVTIGMIGPQPSHELRDMADNVVKDALAKVPGTAAVYVDGGRVREIQVQVQKDRLQAYGMSLSQLVAAINQTNLNIPGGTVKEEGEEYAVRMVGEFTSVDQIEDVQILLPSRVMNGMPSVIRLGDVATVQDTVAEADRISRTGIGDKKPMESVVIAVQKQSGGNSLEVGDGVKAEIALLLGKVVDTKTHEVRDWTPADGPKPQRILPEGVDMVITMDESEYVRESLSDVNKSLFEGILLVVAIVFLFLHSGRATFIVATAIPTSLFATFLPLKALGFTENFMTLLGLSLVVGILVDDSIVVLENIERHLRKGEEPAEAALNGRTEIGLAAIAITLVDVVVFIPIANMGGIVGQFFRPFGWAVAVSAMFSLFMSFTLTPMLASRFFPKGHGSEAEKLTRRGFWAGVFRKFDALYEAGDRFYEAVLAWTLRNRSLTIWTGWATLITVISMIIGVPGQGPSGPIIVMAGIVVGMMLIGMAFSHDRVTGLFIMATLVAMVLLVRLPLSFSFFPDTDRGEFSVKLEAPIGTALGVTDRAVVEAANRLGQLKDPETGHSIVEYLIATTGATSSGASQGAGDAGPHYGSISMKLVDKSERSETLDDVIRRSVEVTSGIPGVTIQTAKSSSMGDGGKPISMEVTGPDMAQNIKSSEALMAVMKDIPGLVDVETSWKTGKPEIQIEVDQERAADKGMVPAAIGSAVRVALQGSGESGTDTKFRQSGEEYTIRVQYDKLDRSDATEVSALIVGTSNGKPVYLRDVANVTLNNAPTTINRKDRQRLITVDANLAQGYSQGNVQQVVTAAAMKIPTGSSRIQIGGMGQMMQESFGYMLSALALAVVLVYMLMAALFESLTTPFVIWLSLPQALIGALLALMITNRELSMVSMIGIIMLMGLVTKNAILLVDYTNTLRSRGKERNEAILEAGPTRLRPVMMTTMAMIGGMMPTALAVSKGSEIRQPMAIAVIGGLLLSTLLTLLVIPVTYTLMDDMVSGARSRWIKLSGRRERPEAGIPSDDVVQPVGGE